MSGVPVEPALHAEADLKLRDPDFVAVPLTRTELEILAELWTFSDSRSHEDLAIQLKALGALEMLRREHEHG